MKKSYTHKNFEDLEMSDLIAGYVPQSEKKPNETTTKIESSEAIQPPAETKQSEPTVLTEPSAASKRQSTKQRKSSFEEYREIHLLTPKITDRQPIFISRDLRDKVDIITRRLGDRRMSVSGFVENLVRHHLGLYREELDRWDKL